MAIRVPGPSKPTSGTLLTNATAVAPKWYVARKRIRPNWEQWRNMAAVELWQAIALSLDIEPPEYYPRGIDRDFDAREAVAFSHLNAGTLPVVEKNDARMHCSVVRLVDVAALASSLPTPWQLPPEFPQLATTRAPSQGEDAPPKLLTPMKRAAIIKNLSRRYPKLESALNRGEEWTKECRTPKVAAPDKKQGWYYFERIEAECRARYGATVLVPTPAPDLSVAGQLRGISG